MKRKKYKVRVKIEYVTAMDHEQTSMERAKLDVKRLIDDYIRQGLDLSKIFNEPPHIIFKVEKYDR